MGSLCFDKCCLHTFHSRQNGVVSRGFLGSLHPHCFRHAGACGYVPLYAIAEQTILYRGNASNLTDLGSILGLVAFLSYLLVFVIYPGEGKAGLGKTFCVESRAKSRGHGFVHFYQAHPWSYSLRCPNSIGIQAMRCILKIFQNSGQV